jgi:hypothetical protein
MIYHFMTNGLGPRLQDRAVYHCVGEWEENSQFRKNLWGFPGYETGKIGVFFLK